MHRMRLVILTGYSEGKALALSVDHIVAVTEREGQDGSNILLSTAQMLEVSETVEQVQYLIEGN